jgi:hypothetical protein
MNISRTMSSVRASRSAVPLLPTCHEPGHAGPHGGSDARRLDVFPVFLERRDQRTVAAARSPRAMAT